MLNLEQNKRLHIQAYLVTGNSVSLILSLSSLSIVRLFSTLTGQEKKIIAKATIFFTFALPSSIQLIIVADCSQRMRLVNNKKTEITYIHTDMHIYNQLQISIKVKKKSIKKLFFFLILYPINKISDRTFSFDYRH